MKNEKVICALLTAAMLIGSCPNYIYASETGGDIEINPGVNGREGEGLIPGEPNATGLENDDTDNIKDKTQSNEGADTPEGFDPNAANDYNKEEATPIEGYEVPDENIQHLRMATIPGEWLQYGSRWWFRHSDGTYTRNGWEWIWGNWYYFDAEGWMVTGWVKSGGKWYYCNENGKMATNWNIIGGVWYYFNTDGSMATNWNIIGGVWYYFNTDGSMATNWNKINGVWYYFNTDGSMATNWNQIGGEWYYFNTDGSMVTNWNQIGGEWYYFDTDGVMQTGWLLKGNTWYYLANNGAMVTGWKWIDGSCFLFNSTGAMQTGWVKDSGNWYYLDLSTGEMYRNCSASIGRVYYEFAGGGEVYQARLLMSRIEQEMDNWCWAAAAQMAGKYKVPSSTVSQADIVRGYYGVVVNVGGTFSGVAGGIHIITGGTYPSIKDKLSFSEMKKEIVDDSDPFVIYVNWSDSFLIQLLKLRGHYMVVRGVNTDTDSVNIIDPWPDSEARNLSFWKSRSAMDGQSRYMTGTGRYENTIVIP